MMRSALPRDHGRGDARISPPWHGRWTRPDLDLRLLYLYRNITRNPLRTLLTCAAVALPIVIFVLSTAVVHGVDLYLDNSVKQLRLVVINKSSVVNPLPEKHRREIESLDPTHQRIVSVSGMVWIGGKVENVSQPLSTLCADHDSFLDAFSEYKKGLTQQQIDNWFRDRQALIVGAATAAQMNWKAGDRVTIIPSLPPYSPMEFHIIALSPPNVDDKITNFVRRDYLDEERKKNSFLAGLVSFYFVKCGSRDDLVEITRTIDEHFAHTTDETKTQDEKAFMTEYINQQFDLPRNLTILSAVTVFVAIMAALNTMSMNFRDRLNEFATLKSLGFSGRFPMALITVESVLVCCLGGLLGAGIPYILFTHTPLQNWAVPIIQHVEIQPAVCGFALLISLGIGLSAGLWPAWLAARMHVVNALRSLE